MSKYSDDLRAALKLFNGYQVSRRYNCPVIFFRTTDEQGFIRGFHNAYVEFPGPDGTWRRSKAIRIENRPAKLTESRQAHVEAAIEWARQRGLGIEQWTPTKLFDTWVPAEVMDDINAKLKAWRTEQRRNARTT